MPSLSRFAFPSFCENPLDRSANMRGDAAWLAALRTRDDAAYVLVGDDRITVAIQGEDEGIRVRHSWSLAQSLGADTSEVALLGLERREGGERPLFAVRVSVDAIDNDTETTLAPALKLIDLRSLARQGALPDDDLGILAQARSLLYWHASHRFCPRCGHATRLAEAGYRRDCPSCAGAHFPRTDPVVIMLVSDGDNCLMGHAPRMADGVFSTLAGFVEPGETIEQAVRREVFEEAGIRVGRVDYLASQPWPFPASLMIGCHGEATSRDITMDDKELDACRWFSRDEVRSMLARTHGAGLSIPPPLSIARWLIREWLVGGD